MQWAILLIVHWGSSCVPIWMHIKLDCLGLDSASGSDRYVMFLNIQWNTCFAKWKLILIFKFLFSFNDCCMSLGPCKVGILPAFRQIFFYRLMFWLPGIVFLSIGVLIAQFNNMIGTSNKEFPLSSFVYMHWFHPLLIDIAIKSSQALTILHTYVVKKHQFPFGLVST